MIITNRLRASAALLGLFISVIASGLTAALAAPAPTPAPTLTPVAPSTLRPVAPPAAAPAPAPAAAPAATALQTPRIIVIDRAFILQRSSAGRDMMSQTQKLNSDAETQFRTEQQQLQTEATQLQQQLAILAPDVRDQKEKEFTAKETSLQQRVQQRQAEIQGGIGKAARQVETALEPILQALMKERGANMLLDRSAVILASADVDVTAVAIQRLDQKLPHVKVDLVKAPAASPAAPAPSTRIQPPPAGK